MRLSSPHSKLVKLRLKSEDAVAGLPPLPPPTG